MSFLSRGNNARITNFSILTLLEHTVLWHRACSHVLWGRHLVHPQKARPVKSYSICPFVAGFFHSDLRAQALPPCAVLENYPPSQGCRRLSRASQFCASGRRWLGQSGFPIPDAVDNTNTDTCTHVSLRDPPLGPPGQRKQNCWLVWSLYFPWFEEPHAGLHSGHVRSRSHRLREGSASCAASPALAVWLC